MTDDVLLGTLDFNSRECFQKKKKKNAGHANQAVYGLELPKLLMYFFFPMFFLVTGPYIEFK